MARAQSFLQDASSMATRILDAERASRSTLSKAEREAALGWYRIQRASLENIAWEAREACYLRGALSMELRADTVIAAAATLSPATAWSNVLRDLPGFLDAALGGDPRPPFATYGGQRVRAARIVRDRLGVEASTGPKVSAFARALAGDASAVVVDRHAARIALGDDSVVGVGIGLLRRIQASYALAGAALGIAPRDLQALVWVARVGMGGDVGGSRIKARRKIL